MKIKDITHKKEGNKERKRKLSLSADMKNNVEYPKESIFQKHRIYFSKNRKQSLLELLNEFSNVTDYKMNI